MRWFTPSPIGNGAGGWSFPGATIREAIAASGLLASFPELSIEEGMVGVWYRVRPLDAPLREGDRVEIYRPLRADPKQARRERTRRG